ncbi:MAG: tetratricopeptide repeat-containing sensor histidine kinase [Gammaproteobacteria bacterium]|nr:tetratricopeptide repeat-containing sensor histidine kinase [Gammaproteobacteria bacterium]
MHLSKTRFVFIFIILLTIKLAWSANDTAFESKIQHAEALVYQDPAAAEQILRELIQDLDPEKDFLPYYRVAINLSDALVGQDKYQQSIETLDNLLGLVESNRLMSNKAQVLSRKSEVYWYQGDVYKAIDLLESSLALYRTAGGEKDISSTLNNLGIMYRHLGDYETALTYLLKALAIKETLGNQSAVATTLNNIGVLYNYLEKYHEAISYFDRSIELYQNKLNDPSLADPVSNKGFALVQLGQLESAVEHFHQSLAIEQETNNIRGQSVSHAQLGSTYRQLNRFDEAQTHLDKAMDLALQTQSPAVLSEAHLQNARLEYDNNNYNEAIKILVQGLDYATVSSEKEKISELHRELSKAYEATGTFDLALRHYRLYKKVSEELIDADTRDRITRLQYKSKLDQREQEINLLKQQNEIKSLRLEQSDSEKSRTLITSIAVVILFCLSIIVLYHRKRLFREREISDELIKLNELKSQFLMQTSNKLLDPVHQIQEISQSVIDEAEEQNLNHRNITKIKNSSKKLDILINNLVDFSAEKNKQLNLQVEALDIHEIVQDVNEIIQSDLLNEVNVNETLTISNQIPLSLPLVSADPKRLHQILFNLTEQFYHSVDKGTLYLHALPVNQQLMIRLSNRPLTGGNRPITDNSLWDSLPFEMNLAKTLIEQLHGEVWIDQDETEYTICFTLPLAPEQKD